MGGIERVSRFSKSLGRLTGLTAKGHRSKSDNVEAHKVKFTTNCSAIYQESSLHETYRESSILPATNPGNTRKVLIPPTQRCVMHRAHRLYWRQLTQASSTRLHQNSKRLPSTTLHVQQCGHRLGKVGNSPHMPCLQTPAQGQPCKASWPPLRWTASGCYIILLRRSRSLCYKVTSYVQHTSAQPTH